MTKIIFTLSFIAILSAGIVLMVLLTQKGSSIVTAPPQSTTTPPEPEEEKNIPQEAATLDTDYFTLALPSGWEGTSATDTLPIIVADSQEEVINEKAKEIDFRTNLSINRGELAEKTLKDYIEGLKAGLVSTIPIMEITKEEETIVDDREAYLLEIESIQQDLKFSTLVILVSGKDNTVWAFSFNTLGESWSSYKDIFYQIVQNIEMK